MTRKLLIVLVLMSVCGISATAQDFNKSYNFINTGTNGPGTSFANTGITSFFISWAPQATLSACSVQVDSSADGVSWGSGDLIASQNCATAGSSGTPQSLASGKNFVRINVTALTGNGSVNVSLKGWGGGGGSPTPGSQISFGNTVSPLAYGAKWDVKFVYDATYSTATNSGGQTTITCPNNDCNFTSADVGKLAIGFQGPFGVQFYAVGFTSLLTNQSTAVPTITAVNGAQSITVSTTAAANCVATSGNQNVCTLAWGSQDDATAINNAMAAAWNTSLNAGKCPALELPSGAAFFGSGILNDTLALMSSACGGQQGTTGGMDLTQTGPQVYGQGMNSTVLIPLPTFNLATQCTKGVSTQGCNFTTPNLEAHDFGINGLANAGSGTQAASLVELDGSVGGASCTGSTGFNINMSTWETNVVSTIGFDVGRNACGDPAYWNNISEMFGAVNCTITAGQQITFEYTACFGATTTPAIFNIGGTAMATSIGGYYVAAFNINAHDVVQINFNASYGIFNSKNDFIFSSYSTNGFNAVHVAAGTGNINMDSDYILFNASNTAASQLIFSAGTTVNIHARNTTFVATGANNKTFLLNAGNNFFNDGGNVFNDGATNSTISGLYVGNPGNSLKGTCTGVANASQATQSMYGTGPNVTGTTCAAQTATVGTGLQVQGSRTMQHLVVTSSATTVAITATVMVNGANSTITCTMTAATSCVDTTHSVALNDGDLVSIKFSTGAAETGANLKAIVDWN